MKHIAMIYGEERPFPPDIRVEKEVRVLSEAGYRITILALRFPKDAPQEEFILDGKVRIIRIEVSDQGKIRKRYDLLRMQKSNWYKLLSQFIQSEKPHVIHVHDFIMTPSVLRIAKRFNIPIVSDLHENMPAAMRAYRTGMTAWHRFESTIYYNYTIMRWHEKRTLQQCEKVIVVVPEAADRLYRYGLSEDQVVVVSNTEDDTTFRFRREDADQNILNKYKHNWVASYIGGIGPHRGLDIALQAVPLASSKIPNYLLLIVGATDSDIDQLQPIIEKYKIEDYVEVIGWQPFDKVNSYVLASDVCLVPHNDFEHTHTTVPHKLFQYMICKKPLLVSSCKPLARIVHDTNAGMIFKTNDSKDMAEKLIYMHSHSEQLLEMASAGQVAALGNYA